MKRNKRFVGDEDHREKVLAMPNCALCGKEFGRDDRPEGHHHHGPEWAKSCKSWERIHVDFRMVKVCGPATDGTSCHAQLVRKDNKAKGTELVIETLREIYGDCVLSEKLEKAGYLGNS